MEQVRFGEGAGGPIAMPGGPGPHPAVVVVPAIAGINDYIERVCKRLATQGYLAVGLDYYLDRTTPDLSDMSRILAAVASLADDEVVESIQSIVSGLGERADVDADRVGMVGFCIGGTYSVLAASRVDGLACSVGFYGLLRYQELTENKPRSPLDTVDGLRVPLLMHYGDDDHLVPSDDVIALQKQTSASRVEVYRYPGAGHAFHEDFRDVYRPVAAQTAWLRTTIYLDWYLRGHKTLLELPN